MRRKSNFRHNRSCPKGYVMERGVCQQRKLIQKKLPSIPDNIKLPNYLKPPGGGGTREEEECCTQPDARFECRFQCTNCIHPEYGYPIPGNDCPVITSVQQTCPHGSSMVMGDDPMNCGPNEDGPCGDDWNNMYTYFESAACLSKLAWYNGQGMDCMYMLQTTGGGTYGEVGGECICWSWIYNDCPGQGGDGGGGGTAECPEWQEPHGYYAFGDRPCNPAPSEWRKGGRIKKRRKF